MKKFVTILLVFMLVMMFAACGAGDALEQFDTYPVIEKTVIYDENNIKITADELTYDTFSAKLSITLENNTDKDLSFVCGSAGYHVNSVNGSMIDDGYLSCDVGAGKSENEVVSFGFNNLNIYGINSIADIEIGFSISDSDYNYIYTGPLQIKTTVADSYDYSVNSYQKVVKNGALEKKFDCKINHFSDEKLYENYNITITSAAIMTNVDGDPALLLEIDNNSADRVFVNIKDVYLNDCLVYESLWSSDSINAGKKCLVNISLPNLADKYNGDFADISTVKDISFTFSVGESWNKTENSKKISVSIPETEIPAKAE